MINNPFKGRDVRIPFIIPTKGRVFVNQGSTLVFPWGLAVCLLLPCKYRVYAECTFGGNTI